MYAILLIGLFVSGVLSYDGIFFHTIPLVVRTTDQLTCTDAASFIAKSNRVLIVFILSIFNLFSLWK